MTDLNGYPNYDPVEERPGFLYSLFIDQPNALIAWCAPYHVPTAEEIASGKYVRRLYRPLPIKWMRWLFGTGEYERPS